MRRSEKGSGRPVQDLIQSTVERTLRFVRVAMHYQVMDSLVRNADPRLVGLKDWASSYTDSTGGVSTTAQVDAVLAISWLTVWVDADDARPRVWRKVRNGDPLWGKGHCVAGCTIRHSQCDVLPLPSNRS